jgi:adenylate cyclase
MALALFSRAYRRLGRRYPAAFICVELQAGFGITAGTVILLSFFYDGTAAEFGLVMLIALGLTALAILWGISRILPRLRPISAWIGGQRDPDSTARAWSAAVGLPLDLIRRDMLFPILAVVGPSCVAGVIVLDLPWTAIFPLLGAAMISVGYGAILHYLTVEAGMRPVLVEINREVSPRFATCASAIPLRVRLLAALPMINVITGLTVAAITGDSNQSLGVAVLVAIGVATTISLELTILLSKSILRPLADLQRATDAVAAGDLDTAVPVTTADEIGELASSFNQMVAGLRERERIRKAFGTYLDVEVADYILSEGFSEEGEDAEVSILFCDVRDFTRFAARADAHEVVSCLNALFEVVVPVISRHGGHVDKFEGDGLMAVFGAPKSYPDHAERAVAAALEIERRVNREGEGGPFEIGIGINTGTVVAGSVGGGGRLNFSVIGDAVNVAARVEAATRELGEAVLTTAETAGELGKRFRARSRGEHRLKGLDRPLELFVPSPVERTASPEPAAGSERAAEPLQR